MAHCPFEKLSDLQQLLEHVRTLEHLKEVKPGIFYLRGQGFLHFHIDKNGKRWADIRDGKKWGTPVDVPQKPRKKSFADLFAIIQKRHAKTLRDY